MINFDTFEADSIKNKEIDLKEKMGKMNAFFSSKLIPENGVYGVVETIKDNGQIERFGKNEFGHTFKEYLTSDGQIYKRREILGGGNNATILFDDNGTAYLRTITRIKDNQHKILSSKLTPDTTITKGNFTAVTDSYGRPVYNKITDLSIRETGQGRQSLNKIIRDKSYKPNDQRGHIIGDNLGGPASKENVVAQLDKVNQGKVARVENCVKNLKEQGHTVDYEVKTNYVGKSERPSSFEYKITVDGQEYTELPLELRKIYNDSTESVVKKAWTNAGERLTERFGVAHETGVKSGLVAAGLTCTVSTVDNMSSFIDGEITAEEMVHDIIEDTAAAGALGYGSAFISTAVSQAMTKSSVNVISKVGGSCAPAAVVAFAVESYEDVSEFAQGHIDVSEFSYNLGENAASVGGSFVGGAVTGATLGTIAGPVGTVAGTVVGGVVGCVVATEAYETAIEIGAEGAEVLLEKAEQFANVTIETVAEYMPEQLEDVKGAFTEYMSEVKLPFDI